MVLNMFTMSRDANQVDFVGPVMIDEFSISRETSSFSYEMQRENMIWWSGIEMQFARDKCWEIERGATKRRSGGVRIWQYDESDKIWSRWCLNKIQKRDEWSKKANVGFERGKVEKNDQEEGGKWR